MSGRATGPKAWERRQIALFKKVEKSTKVGRVYTASEIVSAMRDNGYRQTPPSKRVAIYLTKSPTFLRHFIYHSTNTKNSVTRYLRVEPQED